MKQRALLNLFFICVSLFTYTSTASYKSLRQLNETEINKLMSRQTEAVKKIVQTQQQQNAKSDFPKKIVENSTEINMEDLRMKCQHLEKLFKLNQTRKIENETRRKFEEKQPLTTSKIKGFYVTTDAPKTTVQTNNNNNNNVKYIKLEPVILQKTFLTNGKVLYYWHKSIPTSSILYNSEKSFSTAEPTTTSTTTTTTTPSSMIYSFKNFFPFYSLTSGGYSENYQAGAPPVETISTTTSTTTTTPSPPTSASSTTIKSADFEGFATQLRFVVPVPYLNPENITKEPWEFDQFAYYPKNLQPNKVNIQVPYVPTFHIVKALAVPNEITQKNTE